MTKIKDCFIRFPYGLLIYIENAQTITLRDSKRGDMHYIDISRPIPFDIAREKYEMYNIESLADKGLSDDIPIIGYEDVGLKLGNLGDIMNSQDSYCYNYDVDIIQISGTWGQNSKNLYFIPVKKLEKELVNVLLYHNVSETLFLLTMPYAVIQYLTGSDIYLTVLDGKVKFKSKFELINNNKKYENMFNSLCMFTNNIEKIADHCIIGIDSFKCLVYLEADYTSYDCGVLDLTGVDSIKYCLQPYAYESYRGSLILITGISTKVLAEVLSTNSTLLGSFNIAQLYDLTTHSKNTVIDTVKARYKFIPIWKDDIFTTEGLRPKQNPVLILTKEQFSSIIGLQILLSTSECLLNDCKTDGRRLDNDHCCYIPLNTDSADDMVRSLGVMIIARFRTGLPGGKLTYAIEIELRLTQPTRLWSNLGQERMKLTQDFRCSDICETACMELVVPSLKDLDVEQLHKKTVQALEEMFDYGRSQHV